MFSTDKESEDDSTYTEEVDDISILTPPDEHLTRNIGLNGFETDKNAYQVCNQLPQKHVLQFIVLTLQEYMI